MSYGGANCAAYETMALPQVRIVKEAELGTLSSADSAIVIFHDATALLADATSKSSHPQVQAALETLSRYVSVDESIGKGAGEALLLLAPTAAGDSRGEARAVFASTGPLLRDYDDVRRYGDAVRKAIRRAKASGGAIRSPLIYLQPPPLASMEPAVAKTFADYLQVSILAALAELHEPLETREFYARTDLAIDAAAAAKYHSTATSVKDLFFLQSGADRSEPSSGDGCPIDLEALLAIEAGRRLARDVGGADPERMSAIRASEAIAAFFAPIISANPNVTMHVVDDLAVIKREYPLLAAVNRAAEAVGRHAPRIIHLEYKSGDQSKVVEDLYMVGKGINYDTGGADLKVGGAMVGMSRDKCGAAGLAGFLATVALTRPANVNVSVALAFVRNSIGPDAYVADEIITARSTARVRVGNTDAEGRMVMADLLAEMKERALASSAPHRARLFTCATLTGHVARTYGPYAAAMDNGPARLLGVGERIRASGNALGDCFEVSTLRRDDFDLIAPGSNREDVLQASPKPSAQTNRGHQYPAAFLTIASGLASHGLDAPAPRRLAYTHLDIAGAAEEAPGPLGRLTGTPIAALFGAFVRGAKN